MDSRRLRDAIRERLKDEGGLGRQEPLTYFGDDLIMAANRRRLTPREVAIVLTEAARVNEEERLEKEE